jgi:hypothetical protein
MNLAATIEIYSNRKLHKRLKFQGLDISVENKAGSTRRGVAPGWGPWSTKMKFDYGYIKGSKGMDGGGVDCFIGPNPAAKNAFVVHILKQPDFKTYDEDKVMLGFNSKKEAKDAFMAHYDSPKFYGGMDVLRMGEFKRKVLETATTGPHKIEAWGEPQVYDGGYQHIADTQVMFHPPSLKKAKPVPVDDPMEEDNQFLDVTKRKERATKAFRDRLTKQHTDANMKPLNRTLVSGFPAIGVGGFG